MDECALRFYTVVQVLPNGAEGGTLSRKNGGNSVAYCQVDEELSLENMLDTKVKIEVRKELLSLSEHDFQYNIRLILKNRNIKQSHLWTVIDKGTRTIARMFSRDYDPKEEDILHVCLALKLPKEICDKLLYSAGFILNPHKERDLNISRILTYQSGRSYAKKLEMLEKLNISL